MAEERKLFNEHGVFSPDLQVDQFQVPDGVPLVLGRRLARLSQDARLISFARTRGDRDCMRGWPR